MELLRTVNNILSNIALAAAMAIVLLMVLALTLSASTRFITGIGYDWFIELPPVLVSWLVFPLLGYLLKSSQHIKVDFLPTFISQETRKYLNPLINLIALVSACVFLRGGIDATLLYYNLGQVMELEIEIPMWWMYLAFPVGFLMLALVALELLLSDLRNLIKIDPR